MHHQGRSSAALFSSSSRVAWSGAQDMAEAEMLMGRAEEEQAALRAEVRALRATASEAASELRLARDEHLVRSRRGSPPF